MSTYPTIKVLVKYNSGDKGCKSGTFFLNIGSAAIIKIKLLIKEEDLVKGINRKKEIYPELYVYEKSAFRMYTIDHVNDENIDIDDDRFLASVSNVEKDVIKTLRNADGTTSSHFDKRKVRIAPRSTLQFKIGPSFTPVVPNHKILDDYAQIQEIKLEPRIDRGFDFIDNDWIGYKRNYFTVVTSFDTPGSDHIDFMKKAYYLDSGIEIKYFATKLAAKCLEDDKLISLVQHTAKRDKGPQFAPPIHVIAPANLPKHQIIRDASNVRNESKMKKFDSYFFLHKEDVGPDCEERNVLANYPSDPIKKVARYERIQFASSIALKKTSQQNRRFSLLVVLGCFVKGRHHTISQTSPYHELDHYDEQKDMTFIPIVMEKTPPLIIRGRSPSNYCQQIKVMHTKKSDYETEPSEDPTTNPHIDKKERKRQGRKDKQPNTKLIHSLSHDSLSQIPTLLTSGLPSTFEISPTSGNMRIKNIQLLSSSTETSFPRGAQSESLSVAYLSNSATPIQESIFKKRRLNISKPVLESNLEEPTDDITENIFSTISFDERTPLKENNDQMSSTSVFLLKHVTYCVSEPPPAVAIPRTMLPNKMEISYCLNDYSSSFIDYQPPSTSNRRQPASRRLLTASGNPSDLLNPADWSDGPITRKSLSDQLRENSKKKRQQFQKQTREKNSFTRVSNEDLDHINKIKSDEIEKLREFSQWAESEERKRLKKQRLLQLSTESDGLSSGTSTNSDLIPTEIRIPKEVKSSKMKNTLGVIRKKRTKGVSKPTERGR
ncbi:unnamed protein product [Kluyveromyces dobzhanskii CBS 2104]|uniref:WGS project CCBQ000000000 data, contig 00058 n=1 Tax=Kluyveromyces dobzhanskii CBS 2104 TaxID=1427455 RepID=A0A0A8LDH7_9SACH|nr:unnamed protein product [Kluyveromyces dobzhanskii CBS 2104]